MADATIEDFLSRVMERLPDMSRDKFTSQSWRFEGRPTGEGLGLKPGVDVDPAAVIARIMDVADYPGNVKYVDETIVAKQTKKAVTYTQKMKLPGIGGVQGVLTMKDLGTRDGYRVVAWQQDDAATEALDKKHGGARTEYNLGAWLVSETEVAYALSASPLKSDLGSLKYALMTKGSDATTGTVLATNIDSMIAWSQRD